MVPVSRTRLEGGTGWVGTSKPVDGFGLVTPLGSNYIPSESALDIDQEMGSFENTAGDYYGDTFNLEMPGFDVPSVTYEPGIAGEPGLPGLPGIAGTPGLPGIAGSQGISGERGDIGEAGIAGEAGAAGPAGPMGPMGIGIQGPQGPTGPSGYPGIDGEPGPRGATGLRGPAGVDGVALLAKTTADASGHYVAANIYNSSGFISYSDQQVYLYISGGSNAEYASPLIQADKWIPVARDANGNWYAVPRLSEWDVVREAEIVTVNSATYTCKFLDVDGTKIGDNITVSPMKHLGSKALTEDVWPSLVAGNNVPVFRSIVSNTYRALIWVDDTEECS